MIGSAAAKSEANLRNLLKNYPGRLVWSLGRLKPNAESVLAWRPRRASFAALRPGTFRMNSWSLRLHGGKRRTRILASASGCGGADLNVPGRAAALARRTRRAGRARIQGAGPQFAPERIPTGTFIAIAVPGIVETVAVRFAAAGREGISRRGAAFCPAGATARW